VATTLVVPEALAAALRATLELDVETGAVLLARPVATTAGGLRLLAREIHFVPEQAYVRRESDELVITSDGYVPALGRADLSGMVPIWLHTHPGNRSSPIASAHDHKVDAQLADPFRLRSGSSFYGTLILARDGADVRFTGHLEDEHQQRREIDRLFVVGQRISLAWNYHAYSPSLGSMFDRNVKAFGGDVQRILQDLSVAIVGCGGTGSCIAEQLVRLGVRQFTLIDPDVLSDTNVTRVYGSTERDVGQPKVEVLAGHLRSIASSSRVATHQSMVTVEETARELTGVDLIFGCTDDNAGRLVLSRLSTYLLVPMIDCGVLLSSDDSGQLTGIFGRVTVLHPGTACLVCRDRVDLARARSEMLTPDERIRRADEGYAPALPNTEPAVVAFTTFVAAAAVSELLERLTGFGPEPVPSEVLLRIHDREVSTNVAEPRRNHYCHTDAKKIGLGMTTPFLEQVWQA
jgi:molybdopterin/thiamine biosynthesis adenylyltransferase